MTITIRQQIVHAWSHTERATTNVSVSVVIQAINVIHHVNAQSYRVVKMLHVECDRFENNIGS